MKSDINLPINISLPGSFLDAEEKCGYQITHESKLLWAVILDLMVEFDRVCKQYQIQYSIDGGSLLGAVRHGGFIPWDNDADVIMLRSEYDRLCKIAPQAFQHPYFWQTNETDPGTVRRHAQLRNSLTTGILASEAKDGKARYQFNQGIFLDVFILDEVPDDEAELALFRAELEHQITVLLDFKEYYWASNASPWVRLAQKQAYEEFESIVTRYNGTGQTCIANISLLPHRLVSSFFKKEVFEHYASYTFEGFSFPGPKDYDTVLRGFYGDWHKYVIGGDLHGGLIVDTQTPYTAYLDKNVANEDSLGSNHPLLKLYKAKDDFMSQRDEEIKQTRHLFNENETLRRDLAHKEMETSHLRDSIDRLNKKVRRKRRLLIILGILLVLMLSLQISLIFINN